MDGLLSERVRIPYKQRHARVTATLRAGAQTVCTLGKRRHTETATTPTLHVTIRRA